MENKQNIDKMYRKIAAEIEISETEAQNAKKAMKQLEDF